MTLAEAKRTGPDDYWKNPAFARRYVRNNIVGVQENDGAKEYASLCLAAILQGIGFLAPKVMSVLDVGCGHATRSASIRAMTGARVVGVDYSEPMVEEATRIAAMMPEDHRPEIVHGNAYDLPFDDNSFDVAVCYGLLMSLERPAQTDILRVARYGLVAIEETETAMSPDQRDEWLKVKVDMFPGRIYWHDYLKVFGHFQSVTYNPLPVPPTWNLGTPPAYARFIVQKEEYRGL